MALMLYLIGARSAGKTAVFDALTNTPAGPSFTTKSGHRLGTVKVHDDRLAALRDIFNPKKYIPAEVTFVDVALPPASDKGSGFSQLNAFLGEADAFALVVQTFGDTDGQGQPLNPPAQLDSILLDLAMADLEKVERRIEKIEQELKRGLKQNQPELTTLEKCRTQLENGLPLRTLEFTDDELKHISSFRFLSHKRILIIANTPETDPNGQTVLAALQQEVEKLHLDMLAFCAPIEAEIAALEPEEQKEFLADYGLTEPARHRLIQSAYRTLNLISFFTVGPDEVRAWTIQKGDNAVTAAGKIHTDLARGFIRAETVEAATLIEKGSYAACREAGKLRLEGKNYTVQDADVIEIRANA